MLRGLHLIYPAETAGGTALADPVRAAQWLDQHAQLPATDPYLACGVGDIETVRRALTEDPAWVNRPGGPLSLPPLIAVTHSSLCRLSAFEARMVSCARLLLEHGADPNQAIGTRSPPGSVDAPANNHPLTALYGAVGQNANLPLTHLLLDAGADADDGECLYHSLPHPHLMRLILEAGVPIGPNNALYHAFDFADPTPLRVLLDFAADPNEPAKGPPTSWFGTPLLWAIRRRVSMAHYEALLLAGADTRARTPSGISAWQLARRYGLPDVAALLARHGAPADPGSQTEQFLGACGCAVEPEARRLLDLIPHLTASLDAEQLGLLPELIAGGALDAARLMVRLGWPIDARGADWHATALNLAVFQGNAQFARFLLEHGAHWTETHGFGSNVIGTLSWACRHRPAPDGDWVVCAKVLLEYRMPGGQRSAAHPGQLYIDNEYRPFTDDIIETLSTP